MPTAGNRYSNHGPQVGNFNEHTWGFPMSAIIHGDHVVNPGRTLGEVKIETGEVVNASAQVHPDQVLLASPRYANRCKAPGGHRPGIGKLRRRNRVRRRDHHRHRSTPFYQGVILLAT
ncbi:hypothetical protein AWC22_05655 [Mycobacterium riyadhense]|uniref:Uncharacterized protein n=1 Tax=Mycobacterium riyadhense TaxID=486698 RepID=A0A1X2B9C6_9MYCO|nr:hypothetical protein AWC22_05655 [Mycobacterium riyadhense]